MKLYTTPRGSTVLVRQLMAFYTEDVHGHNDRSDLVEVIEQKGEPYAMHRDELLKNYKLDYAIPEVGDLYLTLDAELVEVKGTNIRANSLEYVSCCLAGTNELKNVPGSKFRVDYTRFEIEKGQLWVHTKENKAYWVESVTEHNVWLRNNNRDIKREVSRYAMLAHYTYITL